ncbi:hypothetical protein [Methanobrevibacter sp. DSM 116169]
MVIKDALNYILDSGKSIAIEDVEVEKFVDTILESEEVFVFGVGRSG